MKKIIIVFVLVAFHSLAEAQVRFIYSGNIEFERKINIHRQIAESNSSWYKNMLKQLPTFHTSTFSLGFDKKFALYQYIPGPPAPQISIIGPAKENAVYTDFEKGLRESRKAVFEENYVVIDSLRNLEWKISDERRTIAGFECRKAVGTICDSVYVVAFYAEEIPVSGGPESFGGLPGMILGLAIPRLYTTWFATKLMMTPATGTLPKAGRRDKTLDSEKLQTVLGSAIKGWGEYAEKYIWWTML